MVALIYRYGNRTLIRKIDEPGTLSGPGNSRAGKWRGNQSRGVVVRCKVECGGPLISGYEPRGVIGRGD